MRADHRPLPRRLARAAGADGLGWVWTLLKTALLAFVVIWLRVSYPRLREDQLQKLAWTALIPLALAQIALTGIVKVAIN